MTMPPSPKSLETAVQGHIDWLGRVMEALQHNWVPQQLRCESEETCQFGRWLATMAPHQGYDPHLLLQLDRSHRAMHRLAADLLESRRYDEAYYETLERFCRTTVDFNRIAASLADSMPALCRTA